MGLALRISLMVLLPLLLDDGILLQGVKYTDIDYDVFTDAARYASEGLSPFNRHTYRYTPFLALILSYSSEGGGVFWWWRKERYFGRMLFCVADALCGLVILQLRQKSRQTVTVVDKEEAKLQNNENKNKLKLSVELQDALWWLYNPLPINICTRGSAESFVVLLSVLGTVSIVTKKESTSRSALLLKAVIGGFIHGLAIHAKLFPIIYTASYMAYFSHKEDMQSCINTSKNSTIVTGWKNRMKPLRKEDSDKNIVQQYPFPWLKPRRLRQLIKLWIFRILTPAPMLFLASSMITFVILTYLAVYFYGNVALEEGLLYHFSRVDHRHNYSMFWYWIYLARARVAEIGGPLASSSMSTMGRALLLPQIILLLFSSLGIAPFDLSFALFVQTFFFVALNKVITAQYFTWYLVLLPLCSERIKWRSKDMILALGILIASILTWLGCAFCLEMKGMSFHLQVWMASMIFFMANVNLLRVMLTNYQGFALGNGKRKDKIK